METPDDKKEQKPVVKTTFVREHKLPEPVMGIAYSPADKMIYAACMDRKVHAVSFEKGDSEVVGQHENYVSSVNLLPDGNTLISAGYDGVLQWHDRMKKSSIRKVKAHDFWSWRSAVSKDGRIVASVTGQYLCGGYKYEPAPEKEPSGRIYDTSEGKLLHSFEHVPPVESVAISPDGSFVAAGNLMGEVRVWDLRNGEMVSQWTTGSFTGWGIIKGHYYTGGIFALSFSPDGEHLLAAGMGSTRDPAAGNGKQLWERFSWRDGKKTGEAKSGQIGQGLMETLAFHSRGDCFVMAGRLFKGQWNTAFFDAASGDRIHSLDTKMRTTSSAFDPDGQHVILAGTGGQGKPKADKERRNGRIKIYQVSREG